MPSPSPFELSVRVPASTSNLGPGFDLLGLALSLWLEVRVRPRADAPGAGVHELISSGPAAQELDGDELLLTAFGRAADELDLGGAFRFESVAGIPVGRGFGSSGAAVAAGLLLAQALASSSEDDEAEDPTRERLLAWGIELEGHPDNVTASLFGGCTLCHPAPEGGAPVRISNPIAPGIGFALAWPPAPLSTVRARAVLPTSVSHADAVENPRRLALLLEGLRTGDARLLGLGGEDRLHVRHRLPLIAGGAQALEAARGAGAWLATISGAGSGLVALGPHGSIESIARAMQDALRAETGGGEARVVEPVLEAPRVTRLAGRSD